MKTYTLYFISLLFLVTPVLSQDYYYGEHTGFGGPSDNLIEVCGDTTIEGNQYRMIRFTTLLADTVFFSSLYPAVLRKEGEKVFYRNTNAQSPKDILLYDYNLEVGESLSYYSDSAGSDILVYTVDSIGVMNINGETKKQFFIKDHQFGFVSIYEGYIVEDIGLVWEGHHPFYFFGAGPDNTFLFSCLYENDNLLFTNPEAYNFIECDVALENTVCGNITNGVHNTSTTFNLSFFPNPVNDVLNLELSISDYFVKIQNIGGLEIWTGENVQTIDFSDFEVGIYFITVQEASSGLEITKRIIKGY